MKLRTVWLLPITIASLCVDTAVKSCTRVLYVQREGGAFVVQAVVVVCSVAIPSATSKSFLYMHVFALDAEIEKSQFMIENLDRRDE